MCLVFMAQAAAARTSRSMPGTADCPTKAWRVLFIAGERQANSWCDKGSARKTRRWKVNEKKKQERGDYEKRKDNERKAKRRADEDRRQRDEDRRQAYKDKHKAEQNERKRKREEYRDKVKRKEQERKDKDAAHKAKREHEKACRGLGLPANCKLPNPGKR